MAVRRNLVVLSGRIEWKSDDIRHVDFKNGGSADYYKVRISTKRETKKDADPAYDSFYVEFAGKDATFAKTYLSVGSYITVEGECVVNSTKKDENGVTVYEEMYTIKVREFNASKGLYLNENEIKVMGYLAKDPVAFSGTISSVAITVIVNRKGSSNNSDAFNVKVFGKSAEFVQKYFHKGDAISVDGRMQPAYFRDNVWHNNAEIVSNFVRNPMGNADAAVQDQPAQAAQAAPVQPTQAAQAAPVQQAPVQTQPAAPVQQAPVQTEPVAPVQQAPVQAQPAAPVQQAPVQTEPVAPAQEVSNFDADILSDLGLDLNDVADIFG